MRTLALSLDKNIPRVVLPSQNSQVFHLYKPSFGDLATKLPTSCYVFPKYLDALQQPVFELELPKNSLDPQCNDSTLIDVDPFDNFVERQPSKEVFI